MSDWALVAAAAVGAAPGTLIAWWSHQDVTRKTRRFRLSERVSQLVSTAERIFSEAVMRNAALKRGWDEDRQRFDTMVAECQTLNSTRTSILLSVEDEELADAVWAISQVGQDLLAQSVADDWDAGLVSSSMGEKIAAVHIATRKLVPPDLRTKRRWAR